MKELFFKSLKRSILMMMILVGVLAMMFGFLFIGEVLFGGAIGIIIGMFLNLFILIIIGNMIIEGGY